MSSSIVKVLAVALEEAKKQETERDSDSGGIQRTEEQMDQLIKAMENMRIQFQDMKKEMEYVKGQGEDTKIQLENTKTELNETKIQLEESKIHREETKIQLENTKTELNETKIQLEESKIQIEDTKIQLQNTKTELLNETKIQLEESKIQLDESKIQLDESKIQLDESKIQLNVSKIQLDKFKIQREDCMVQLEDSKTKISEFGETLKNIEELGKTNSKDILANSKNMTPLLEWLEYVKNPCWNCNGPVLCLHGKVVGKRPRDGTQIKTLSRYWGKDMNGYLIDVPVHVCGYVDSNTIDWGEYKGKTYDDADFSRFMYCCKRIKRKY